MKSITWKFSTTHNIISDAIRIRTNSSISHVDVVTQDGAIPNVPGGQLLGAHWHPIHGNGFLPRPPNYDTFTKVISVTLPVTDEQYTAFWSFTAAQIGKPYDLTAIFGIMVNRNWRETDSWFCSEVCGASLEAAHILHIQQQMNWLDPETLLNIMASQPNAVYETSK